MNLSATMPIGRSPEEVFSWVIDVSHDPRWRTGVVESGMRSEGPVGSGSVGFTRGLGRGSVLEAEWRITEFEAGRLARWEFLSGPYRGTGGYRCLADAGGTRFTLEADIRATGFLRLLGPLFGVIGRRQNRADVGRLKSILEGKAG